MIRLDMIHAYQLNVHSGTILKAREGTDEQT